MTGRLPRGFLLWNLAELLSGCRAVDGAADLGQPAIGHGGRLAHRFEVAQALGDYDQVVAGLQEIAARGHARGLRMLVATIAPCEGEARCTAAADAQRVAVNEWIRGTDEFDGVLDFDRVLRDPDRPARMLPAYDSGDHLHPGEAGLAALAASVDPLLL